MTLLPYILSMIADVYSQTLHCPWIPSYTKGKCAFYPAIKVPFFNNIEVLLFQELLNMQKVFLRYSKCLLC